MYRVAVEQPSPQDNCFPQPETSPPQYESCPPQPSGYYPQSTTAPRCPAGYQPCPTQPLTRPPQTVQYPRPTQVLCMHLYILMLHTARMKLLYMCSS